MRKELLIVINSSNRGDTIKTHEYLAKYTGDWLVVVPFKQGRSYVDKCFDNLYVMPKHVPGYLSSQRQWVLDTFGTEYKYIWFMDDDLQYLYRDTDLKLRKATTIGIPYMIDSALDLIRDKPVGAVGVSTRFMNYTVKDDFIYNKGVKASYVVDVDVLRENNIFLNPIEPFSAEDTHMSISLLNAGYKTIVLYNYAWTEKVNAKGGCSVYRTAEVIRNSANWMRDNHQEVTIRELKTKSDWGLEKGEDGFNIRPGIMVKWKKCFKERKC